MSAPHQAWTFHAPPGWPTPPPGWSPSPGWRPDPSWSPAPPGWQWWSPPAEGWAAQPFPWNPAILPWVPSSPRRRRTRAALVSAYVGGLLVGMAAIGGWIIAAFTAHVDREDYASTAAYDYAWYVASAEADPYLIAWAFLGPALLIAVLARRAGYRWFDLFFVLVPVWGFVVVGRLLWRWTDIRHWNRAPLPEPARSAALV